MGLHMSPKQKEVFAENEINTFYDTLTFIL